MGRYIDTSLCKFQDQQKPFTNHSWQVWRSIYNSHIDFKISSTVIRVKGTSYARKCTKPLGQRYKTKQVLRQNLTMSIKLLIFYFLCGFWIFDTKKKKLIKSNNVKTAKTDKVNNNQ